MAWTKVQNQLATGTVSGSTCTLAFGSNVTSGNLLVVCVDTHSNVAISSVTDNLSTPTVYTLAVGVTGASNANRGAIYFGICTVSGACTPKVTFASAPTNPNMGIGEFSGAPTTVVTDQTSSSTGTTNSITSGTTATLASTTDLAIGYLFTQGSSSAGGVPGAPWVSLVTSPAGDDPLFGYAILSASTGLAYTNTGGSAGLWGGLIAILTSGVTNVNSTVSIAASASQVNTAFNTHRSTASIAASANTSQSRGVLRRAGTASIAGTAAGTLHGVIGQQTQVIFIGRATTGSVFRGLVAIDRTTAILPFATLSLISRVTHPATASIAGLGDLDPPAATMPTFVNADVHIFGLATGSIVVPVEAQAVGRFNSSLLSPTQVTINGRASFVPLASDTRRAIVSFSGRATSRFSALVTGIGTVSGAIIFNSRGMFTPRGFVTKNSTVQIHAGNPLVQTRNATLSLQGSASISVSVKTTHDAVLSILGKASDILNGLVTGPVFVSAQSSIRPLSSFAPNPFVTRQSTVSLAGRSALSLSAQDLANLNGKVTAAGRAVLVLIPRVTHQSTVSIAGKTTPVFLGSVQGPNLLNSVVSIQGHANLRPQLLGVPVLGKVSFIGRSTLVLTPFIATRVPATGSLGARSTGTFLAVTQGGSSNAVVRIAAHGNISVNAFLTFAPVVNFQSRASSFLRASLIQRAIVSISGSTSFTPKTPHQALIWVSSNNLQYKVWQFNLEQMVRVLGTTFTVTSVGLSFQSVALELSSSDAGWGS